MSTPEIVCRFSTAIQRCDIAGAAWLGRFYLVGSVPATCADDDGKSLSWPTEAEALAAILADPWIKATPDQTIQGADCRIIQRP